MRLKCSTSISSYEAVCVHATDYLYSVRVRLGMQDPAPCVCVCVHDKICMQTEVTCVV